MLGCVSRECQFPAEEDDASDEDDEVWDDSVPSFFLNERLT